MHPRSAATDHSPAKNATTATRRVADAAQRTARRKPAGPAPHPPLGDTMLVPVIYRRLPVYNPTDISKSGTSGFIRCPPRHGHATSRIQWQAGVLGDRRQRPCASAASFAEWVSRHGRSQPPNRVQNDPLERGKGNYVNRFMEPRANSGTPPRSPIVWDVGQELLDANGNPIRAPSSTNNRQLSPRRSKPTARRNGGLAYTSSRAAAKPTTAAPTQAQYICFEKSMATRSSSRSTATPYPCPEAASRADSTLLRMLRRPGFDPGRRRQQGLHNFSFTTKYATGSSMTRRKPTPSTSLR